MLWLAGLAEAGWLAGSTHTSSSASNCFAFFLEAALAAREQDVNMRTAISVKRQSSRR